MTIVAHDLGASYFQQPNPGFWTLGATIPCTPLVSLQMTHSAFEDSATLDDVGVAVFFPDREVHAGVGAAPDSLLTAVIDEAGVTGELTGALQLGPFEDLLRAQADDPLPQFVITHLAFQSLPTEFAL